MKSNQIVTPSSQVDSTLPRYVYENYSKFVNFMSASAESEERIGFGQDILQNLQKYRNFDTYKNQIVQFENLKDNISATDDELTLESGYGFPDKNGVLLIDDEVILYQSKEGNVFSGLERGASGTKVLPTFRTRGTYVVTTPALHKSNAKVTNLSVLFLVAMLDNIHQSFTPAIDSVRIAPEINRSTLLQNIKDFFASKGSKLGVQALFRMLFAENDVDVTYPGDRMIVPSKSTWYESVILRTVPVPEVLTDPKQKYTNPDKVIGSEILYKSYVDDKVHATAVCDYVSSYPYESEIQYELFVDEDNIKGKFFANPKTVLRRTLNVVGSVDDREDVTTITVESTNGFPDSGVVIIESEAISYTSKSFNQFLGCKRGYIGVEATHLEGTDVYGPYYIETSYTDDDGEVYYSRSFPLGLVQGVEINDPGVLHRLTDEVFVNQPGDTDDRDQATNSFVENTGYALVQQNATLPSVNYVGNISAGVSGVYYDDDYVFVTSSTLPYYSIGTFSTDNSVGPQLTAKNAVFVIPRRDKISSSDEYISKGSGTIGVFADGVPAISNEGNKLYHGSITSFNIQSQGGNYSQPTVLINESVVSGVNATVSGGLISSISGVGSGFYNSIPNVRITSGENASISLTFDKYGRVTTATITNGGSYYNDAPIIRVQDASGRGKGAILTTTVTAGRINSVIIAGSGIDYVATTTTAVVVPIGSGAIVSADVEYFTFDRVKQIKDNPTQDLDSGNGFIFNDPQGSLSQFGYVAAPVKLEEQIGKSPDGHSPLIGWAFDGNPIYGPEVYVNGTNANDGVKKAYSAYFTPSDRLNLKSSSGTVDATNPPSTTTYPMGTFLEDYIYDESQATFSNGRINSELVMPIKTEGNDYILSQFAPGILLDQTNGRTMNTPEFPEDLYPGGVFCYIATSIGVTPYFPYIIGAGFQNQPVSQNVSFKNGSGEITTYKSESTDNKSIEFNLDDTKVHRVSGMSDTGDGVSLEIASISSGSISEIYIEEALPATTKVGDILRFDSSNTKGGGAEGKVSHLNGVNVGNAFGQEIVTRVISHRQRINLRFDTTQKYTFAKDSFIRTSSGAEAIVDSYDSKLMFLDVTTTTENLIKFGDTFSDNKGRSITIPSSQDGNDQIMFDYISGAGSTFISYTKPEPKVASPGDLWWSSEVGTLFIYFDDGDTSQWVSTQPFGMRPLYGVSDSTMGQPGPVSQLYSVPQAEGKVTISLMAPSGRTDGTANQRGDLWWSPHSGMLYMWNSDKISDYEQGELEWSGEWVTTDPSGTRPGEGASNVSDYGIITPPETSYEATTTVIIKETSPTTMQDGSALFAGALWWSPLNGRLYIYFTDADSSQWVVTNPYGILTSQYGNNSTVVGDGGTFPDYLTLLPYLTSSTDFWFESLKYFEPGDTIEFRPGAPGVTSLVEQALIKEKLSNNHATLLRGTNGVLLEIPHGTKTYNASRGIYTVDTSTPHGLRTGDEIIISGSDYPEVNGKHTIENAGVVIPATGTVTIINGEITAVNITSPGNFYSRDFYITFVGGGGQGALAFATIADLVDGGGVESVAMLEGGINYTSQPTIIFGDETPNTRFTFFTSSANGEDTSITYITDTLSIRGTPARIAVTSPGVGYERMPVATGLLKKQGDRAQTKITMSGSTIESVEVLTGGFRYVNPIAVFQDSTGAGSGAEATVNILEGIVQTINVTRSGSGYVDPYLEIIEDDGKYIPLTTNIGQIKSIKVLNPGRNITSDISLTPELQVQTRLIVSPTDDSTGIFRPGQLVYQGTTSLEFATATVVSYDSERQILFVEQINGEIKENEVIQTIFGTKSTVLREGQADLRVDTNGTSKPVGKFIDDTSKSSEKYAVIQDSDYYQYFSYSISSTIQEVLYKDFVLDIIHPAGFAMFSEMKMTDNVNSPSRVFDVTFSGAVDFTGKDMLLEEDEDYLMTETDVFIEIQVYEILIQEGTDVKITTESGDDIDMTTQGVWEAFVNENGDYVVTELGNFIGNGRLTEIDNSVRNVIQRPDAPTASVFVAGAASPQQTTVNFEASNTITQSSVSQPNTVATPQTAPQTTTTSTPSQSSSSSTPSSSSGSSSTPSSSSGSSGSSGYGY